MYIRIFRTQMDDTGRCGTFWDSTYCGKQEEYQARVSQCNAFTRTVMVSSAGLSEGSKDRPLIVVVFRPTSVGGTGISHYKGTGDDGRDVCEAH